MKQNAPSLLAIALAGIVSGFCLLAPVVAQPATKSEEQIYDFDIPAMSLPDALCFFSITSRIAVAAPSDRVAGLRSATLKGRYTAKGALKTLLTGAELSVRKNTPRSFTLIEAPKLLADRGADKKEGDNLTTTYECLIKSASTPIFDDVQFKEETVLIRSIPRKVSTG